MQNIAEYKRPSDSRTPERAVRSARPAVADRLWVVPALAAAALVPWTVGLATRLPRETVAHNWNVAWAGLDVAIAAGLSITSVLGRRRDPRARMAAGATVALMCADAWFDICTSGPGAPLATAIAEGTVEIGLAGVCLAIGLRTGRSER
jgi:hypothetical protein